MGASTATIEEGGGGGGREGGRGGGGAGGGRDGGGEKERRRRRTVKIREPLSEVREITKIEPWGAQRSKKDPGAGPRVRFQRQAAP